MTPRHSSALTAALVLLVLFLLGALSQRHDLEADWTHKQRNSLSEASRQLLDGLSAPVQATAYVYADLDARRAIRTRLAPYLRHKPDFSLRFVDPVEDPQTVRELDIARSGEVLFQYQNRQERLSRLSESEISAALQRLAYAEQTRIAFIQGHRERDPYSETGSGYAQLRQILEQRGLRVGTLSLATERIPEDVKLLVLAAPQTALLPAEEQQLKRYLDNGGNLLWLLDPGLPMPQSLSETLGVQALAGTVIYQDYELLGSAHPAIALVADYPDHPATRNFKELTAFALSGGLAAQDTGWRRAPLLRSVERAWLETGSLEGSLVFSEAEDTYGPITLGLSLQRQVAGREQRVIVIADSDFAANAYLSQLGNRAFTAGLFQWLSHRDSMLRVDVSPAPDAQLTLSPLTIRLLAAGFLLVLPIVLLGAGLRLAWRRRYRR